MFSFRSLGIITQSRERNVKKQIEEDFESDKCCGVAMIYYSDKHTCSKCGKIKFDVKYELNTYEDNTSYNIDSRRSKSLVFQGRTQLIHLLNELMPKEYEQHQYQEIVDMLISCNKNSVKKVNSKIIKKTATLYNPIQKNSIKRGENRTGLLMFLMGRIARDEGIMFTPEELSSFGKVSESKITKGGNIITEFLKENTHDEIEKLMNARDDRGEYTRYYLDILEADIRYEKPILEILKRFDKSDTIGFNGSLLKTRIAGIIYMIAVQNPKDKSLRFTIDKLSEKLNITASTVKKFHNYIIENRILVNPILRKHRVHRIKIKKNEL